MCAVSKNRESAEHPPSPYWNCRNGIWKKGKNISVPWVLKFCWRYTSSFVLICQPNLSINTTEHNILQAPKFEILLLRKVLMDCINSDWLYYFLLVYRFLWLVGFVCLFVLSVCFLHILCYHHYLDDHNYLCKGHESIEEWVHMYGNTISNMLWWKGTTAGLKNSA